MSRAREWMAASWAHGGQSDSLSHGRWTDQQFFRHAAELLGAPWEVEPRLLPDHRLRRFRNRSEYPGVGLHHKAIPHGAKCSGL